MTETNIAQVAHELNKAYCESIGDFSQPSWDDAPDWQKDSAIKGVKFHIANPDATPENSHESWLKQKQDEGWKYGPEKKPETKEHPCFVPYSELPASQKAKDYIFRQTIHSLKKFLPTEQAATGELTFGQKAVGLSFNPSGDGQVEETKKAFAFVIDKMNGLRNLSGSGEQKRLCSVAITEAQGAQMWAVKAITWRD